MAVRTKTRQRLQTLLIGFVATGLLLSGAYVLRKRQIAAKVLRDRDVGYLALKDGDYLTALRKIGPYVRRNPDGPEGLLEYAIARSNVEEPNGKHIFQAISMFRWLLEVQPDNAEARERLLELYISIGFNTEIRSATEGRKDAASLRARAIALANTGANTEAENIARQYNEMKPTDLKMQMFTCYQMFRRNVPGEQIVAQATKLQQAYPKDPKFQLLVGFAQSLAGNNTEALSWTRKAATGSFDEPEVVRAAADQLDQLGQLDESLALLQRTAQVRGDISFQRNVISRLYQGGRFTEVVDKTADLERDPSKADVELVAHRALAFLELNRQSEAQRAIDMLSAKKTSLAASAWAGVLNAANSSSPDEMKVIIACREALKTLQNNAYVHLYFGDALAGLGEGDAAVREWQTSARLAPVWGRPVARIVPIVLASGAAIDRKQWIDHLQLIARDDPDSLASLAISKVIVLKDAESNLADESVANQVNAIIKLIDRVQELRPGEERTLALKVDLLSSSNRLEQARATIQTALDPAHPAPAAALIRLARASRTSKLELESQCLQQTEAAYGHLPQIALFRASDLIRDGKAADAVKVFEASLAAATGQDDPAWQVALARLLEAARDPRAAAQWARVADAQSQNPLVQYSVLASAAAQEDKALLSRAIGRLANLIGDDGVNWRIAEARLTIQSATGKAPEERQRDLVKAATSLNDLTHRFPDLLPAQLLLSDCLFQIGQKEGAADHMAIATRLAPGALSPALRLASLLQSMGDFERAQPYLDQAEGILRQQNPSRPSTMPAEIAVPGSVLTGSVASNGQSTTEAWRTLAALRAAAGQTDRAIAILKTLNQDGIAPDIGLVGLLSRRGELTDEICRQLLTQPSPANIGIVAEYFVATARTPQAEETIRLLDALNAPVADRELARAMYLRRRGLADESIQRLRAACAADPAHCDAQRALVSSLLIDGKADDALAAAADASRALATEDRQPYTALAQNPSLVKNVMSMNSARALLIVSLNGNSAEVGSALNILSSGLAANRPLPQIAAELRPIADKSEGIWPMQSLLIEMYGRAGDLENAIAIAARSIKLFPTDPAPAQLTAQILAASGKWYQVIGVAKEWRDRSGTRTAAPDLMLAQAYLQTGNVPGAIKLLEPYVESARKDPVNGIDVLTGYTNALASAGRISDAEKLLEPALSSHGEVRNLWRQLAMRQGVDDATSFRWLQKLSAQTPATAVDEQVNLAGAWEALARRMKTDPVVKRTAQQTLAAASSLVSGSTDARAVQWTMLGLIKESADDPVGAELAYREAIKRDPKDVIALNNLAMIITHRNGDAGEALNFASRAVAQSDHPFQATFLDTLGLVQENGGQHDKAEDAVRQALKLQPLNASIQADLVQILLNGGKTRDLQKEMVYLEQLISAMSSPDPKLVIKLEKFRSQITTTPKVN